MNELVGSVIKRLPELLGGTSRCAALVPRLVPRGNGTGNIIAYNLRLTNAGETVAYGIQIGVPLVYLQSLTGADVADWWGVDSRLIGRVFSRLSKFLPARAKRWLAGRRLFLAHDVGLILAPGESTELYFGLTPISGNSLERDALKWRPGQIIELYLLWHNSAPSWSWWPKRQASLRMAIHTNNDLNGNAHTCWKRAED